ncbi:MAG TPA: helix-turn-helix domain-containing protein [Streptosporangiaceae bacterium]|nr:helix-turn-helix domain-containing protein [Streptosporangiaceae bacterium]
MKAHNVAVLALPTTVMLDLAIPVHVFGYHGEDRYQLRLAGVRPGPVRTAEGITVGLGQGLRSLASADTIVVPGYTDLTTPPEDRVLRALRDAAAGGARLISICTGAFALGYAGLLNGRRVTTHWALAPLLAQTFPGVGVDPNVLYVDDGEVLTSAGVAAGLDLCLHVVRQDYGARVAAAIARQSVIAPHRAGGQAQYIETPMLPDSAATGLSATRSWAIQHLDEPIDLAGLARQARLSKRTLSRRFRAETGTTPMHWLLSQRLLRAQRLLESTDAPVETVAQSCGFGSAAILRRHFARATRTTPTAYRRAFTTRDEQPLPASGGGRGLARA